MTKYPGLSGTIHGKSHILGNSFVPGKPGRVAILEMHSYSGHWKWFPVAAGEREWLWLRKGTLHQKLDR